MTETLSIVLPENPYNTGHANRNWPRVSRFAEIVAAAFAGKVAVLPNSDVLLEAVGASCKGRRDVTLTVVADDDTSTTYGLSSGFHVKIDAETGDSEVIDAR